MTPSCARRYLKTLCMRQRGHYLRGVGRRLATDEVSLARAVLQETLHPDLGVF
jgi:hypothetical protein